MQQSRYGTAEVLGKQALYGLWMGLELWNAVEPCAVEKGRREILRDLTLVEAESLHTTGNFGPGVRGGGSLNRQQGQGFGAKRKQPNGWMRV
jgi:hypothetical protein